MNKKIAGFDWDDGNTAKCQKHGVAKREIEIVFKNQPLVSPDPKHSTSEDRFLAIGRDSSNRPIFIVFTMRQRNDETFIRPISARYMHKKEIDAYENRSKI